MGGDPFDRAGRLVSRRERDSHRQYKHMRKPGRVTIAGKRSETLAPGTLNSILKQAGIKEQR
jgi:predicted RNA binding protein YcfA (HicA-like mRNA interferase family)